MAHATIPEALRAGRSASYLVLLRMGFGMRARSLARRWALTPPFHPYPCGRCIFCATFRESLRAAVSGHPALWSPDFPLPIEGKRSPDSLRRNKSSIFSLYLSPRERTARDLERQVRAHAFHLNARLKKSA